MMAEASKVIIFNMSICNKISGLYRTGHRRNKDDNQV